MENIRMHIEEAIEHSPRLLEDGSNVACQGTEGSYSQEAASRIFRNPSILFFKNFEGVFSAIEKGLCCAATASSPSKTAPPDRSIRFTI